MQTVNTSSRSSPPYWAYMARQQGAAGVRCEQSPVSEHSSAALKGTRHNSALGDAAKRKRNVREQPCIPREARMESSGEGRHSVGGTRPCDGPRPPIGPRLRAVPERSARPPGAGRAGRMLNVPPQAFPAPGSQQRAAAGGRTKVGPAQPPWGRGSLAAGPGAVTARHCGAGGDPRPAGFGVGPRLRSYLINALLLAGLIALLVRPFRIVSIFFSLLR